MIHQCPGPCYILHQSSESQADILELVESGAEFTMLTASCAHFATVEDALVYVEEPRKSEIAAQFGITL